VSRIEPNLDGDAKLPRCSSRQVLFCLLLIGFLLYNPFAALVHSHTGLSVDHLARNRATVGASELAHYSPVTKNGLDVSEHLECIGDLVPVYTEQDSPLPILKASRQIFRLDFSPALYFRPPPV